MVDCAYIKSAYCKPDNLGDNVKHKHCEVIKAWADGAVVQIWSPHAQRWFDVAGTPGWGDDKFRVKPETVRFRPYQYMFWVAAVRNEEDAKRVERLPDFRGWLTDWREVEV